MSSVSLSWLNRHADLRAALRGLRSKENEDAVSLVKSLAKFDMDFVQINFLDQIWSDISQSKQAEPDGLVAIRLAVLGSSTISHLLPSIRVGGLRHGFNIKTCEGDYGSYQQDLYNSESAVRKFNPDVVLFVLDSHHILKLAAGDASLAVASFVNIWSHVTHVMKAIVLQNCALPVFPNVIGENESRYGASSSLLLTQINQALRAAADLEAGVHLVSLDSHVAQQGLSFWYSPAVWHRAKQEISLRAAPFFGDIIARLIGACLGRSYKVLVLDLDNTLWGGVIGDDGLSGIIMGPGSSEGEGFLEFQRYVLELSDRGIILAVCSKNDDAVAREVFKSHPEILLRLDRIACFVANWEDKATNIRRIARELNVGLDAIVFVDDNPYERELVRVELPMVAVPEIPTDIADVPFCLAQAGYFEAVNISDEDRIRTRQYQENRLRQAHREAATDMESYLRGLDMHVLWSPFRSIDLPRIVQLVNKTNQFNVSALRLDDIGAQNFLTSQSLFGLYFRLSDKMGDNGIISVVTGRIEGDHILTLDRWLMSCRVLGRKVENTVMDVVAEVARSRGILTIAAEYIPTSRNSMVSDLYDRLSFSCVCRQEDGHARYVLDLSHYVSKTEFTKIERMSS